MLLEKHQVDASVDQLHAVISEHPDNASAHYALMLAYREQGKMTEAGEEMVTFKKIQQAEQRAVPEQTECVAES